MTFVSSALEAEPLPAAWDDIPTFPALKTPVSVAVNISLVVRILTWTVGVLTVSGTAANYIIYHVVASPEHPAARLLRRFDLGFEPSLSSWYSSNALLFSSLLLALITVAKWKAGDRFRTHWLVLAIGFLCMSLDEGVRFHEMVNTALVMLNLKGSGLFFFPWGTLACLIVAVVGVSYIPFLLHLDPRTRALFVCAGAIYVAGAVGVDVIGAAVVKTYSVRSIYHTLTTCAEEGLEMAGIVVFIHGLLMYIWRQYEAVEFCLRTVCRSR